MSTLTGLYLICHHSGIRMCTVTKCTVLSAWSETLIYNTCPEEDFFSKEKMVSQIYHHYYCKLYRTRTEILTGNITDVEINPDVRHTQEERGH